MGTAGTVSFSGSATINAGSVEFVTSGYTVQSTYGNLHVVGSTPSIQVDDGIDATIGGNNGSTFTKTGLGTLTSGFGLGATIDAGTLKTSISGGVGGPPSVTIGASGRKRGQNDFCGE